MSWWTEEREAILLKLTTEGKSANDIAAYLGEGVTRNAVISKWHRSDWYNKDKVKRPRKPRGPKKANGVSAKRDTSNHPWRGEAGGPPKPIPLPVLDITEEESAEIMANSIPLMEMNDKRCHWVTRDASLSGPVTALYCGRPGDPRTEEGYCELHGPRMRVPGSGMRARGKRRGVRR